MKFDIYKKRKIEFRKTVLENEWKIKVYTMTYKECFQSTKILELVYKNLETFLETAKRSDISTYQHSFLIVHEAREGVIVLFNWWTGGEMIETVIKFIDYNAPLKITNSPYHDHSLLCVWEIELFMHERQAWITHILSKPNKVDFDSYLNDTFPER